MIWHFFMSPCVYKRKNAEYIVRALAIKSTFLAFSNFPSNFGYFDSSKILDPFLCGLFIWIEGWQSSICCLFWWLTAAIPFRWSTSHKAQFYFRAFTLIILSKEPAWLVPSLGIFRILILSNTDADPHPVVLKPSYCVLHGVNPTLIKKKTKFSLFIRKFRWKRLQSH
jgi:hypothetical protein